MKHEVLGRRACRGIHVSHPRMSQVLGFCSAETCIDVSFARIRRLSFVITSKGNKMQELVSLRKGNLRRRWGSPLARIVASVFRHAQAGRNILIRIREMLQGGIYPSFTPSPAGCSSPCRTRISLNLSCKSASLDLSSSTVSGRRTFTYLVRKVRLGSRTVKP